MKKYQKKNKNYNIHNNNKTKKHIRGNSENSENNSTKIVQKGGEVQALEDVDYSKFGVSKYINANIDWGIMPGPPPMDCVIL